jgi:hypothetical protein
LPSPTGNLRRAHVPSDRPWHGRQAIATASQAGRAVPRFGRRAFIWPYDGQARLIGENLYEDKTSLVLEEVSPEEAITASRVREIHRERLSALEAERGARFWVLNEDV